MKVFVTGATGVLGRAAVSALLHDGHAVTGLARSEAKAAELAEAGADAVQVSLFDQAGLTEAFRGFDAVANLATHMPVGVAGIRPGAWKVNDRVRVEGSKIVVQAAHDAGVRRLVQESVSFLYADAGDEWITEDSTLSVTRSLDPAAVAEANAMAFACKSRRPVVLRFGNFIGDDPMTTWRLAQARAGRPIGARRPAGLGARGASRRRGQRRLLGARRSGRCLQRRSRSDPTRGDDVRVRSFRRPRSCRVHAPAPRPGRR